LISYIFVTKIFRRYACAGHIHVGLLQVDTYTPALVCRKLNERRQFLADMSSRANLRLAWGEGVRLWFRSWCLHYCTVVWAGESL